MAEPTPFALRPLSRSESRDIDTRCIEEFGLPGIALMENAGRGATEVLCQLGIAGNVLIVAGKGNNGGDGFVIARHLQLRGLAPTIILACDPHAVTGDARTNLKVALAAGLRIEPADDLTSRLAEADWVIDALLGTGVTGSPRSPVDEFITAINAASARVVAIDIPSGLDCDSGEAPGACIEAHHTITFVSPKLGLTQLAAERYAGRVHVVGIGAPLAVLKPYAV